MGAPIIKHFGKIVNGVQVYYNPNLLIENLKQIEADGGEFVETIKLRGKKISNDTYAYFFGGVIKTALQYEPFGGWSKEELRYHYEDIFLSEDVMTKTLIGAVTKYEVVRKHVKIDEIGQKGMNEFTERCIEDLANKGIVILSPEQYNLEQWNTINKMV